MGKSLAFRIWVGMGTILATFAVSGVLSILSVILARDAAMAALEITGPTLIASERMDRSLLRQHLQGRMYAVSRDKATLRELEAERGDYRSALAELDGIDNGFEGSAEADRIDTLYAEFSSLLDSLIIKSDALTDTLGGDGYGVAVEQLFTYIGFVESAQKELSAAIDDGLRARTQTAFDDSMRRAESVAVKTVAAVAGMSALAAAVAVLMGILIMRGVRKPLASLSTTIAAIADGDRSARARGVRIAEFQPLATSFDAMVDRLDSAERELMLSYYEQRKLLDAIPVGLLSIGDDYRIGPEYSAAAKELFGRIDLSGVALDELLYPGDDEDLSPRRSELRRYLKQLFHNMTAEADFLAEMNPVSRLAFHDVEGVERTLGIAFERIYDAEKVTGLLASVRDMTDTALAEQRLASERVARKREVDCIQSILTIGPLPLNDFIGDARREIAGIRADMGLGDDEAINRCFRSLHSLKGSAGSLGLAAVAELAHESEDIFGELRAAGERPDAQAAMAINVSLGTIGDELDSVEDLVTRLRESLSKLDAIESGDGERDELAEFSRQLEAMASQLEKSLSKPMAIVADIRVSDMPRWKDMKNAIIHLVRNAADHGLEDTFDRLFAGKSDKGTIKVTIRPSDSAPGSVIVDVEDDGSGIDFERVERKAIAAGLLAGPGPYAQARLLPCIFSPGFSTMDEASDISGRGVGLDLVRELVKSANGTIAVATEKGRGTRFRISIPA